MKQSNYRGNKKMIGSVKTSSPMKSMKLASTRQNINHACYR